MPTFLTEHGPRIEADTWADAKRIAQERDQVVIGKLVEEVACPEWIAAGWAREKERGQ